MFKSTVLLTTIIILFSNAMSKSWTSVDLGEYAKGTRTNMYVINPDGILSPDEENSIASKISSKGGRVYFTIIESIKSIPLLPNLTSFATAYHDRLISQVGNEHSTLDILCVKSPGFLYTTIGSSVREELSDAYMDQLMQAAVNKMESGDHVAAIEQFFTDLKSFKGEKPSFFTTKLILSIIGFVMFIIICISVKICLARKSHSDTTIELQNSINNESNCPICKKDVVPSENAMKHQKDLHGHSKKCTHKFHPHCVSGHRPSTNCCPECNSTLSDLIYMY